MTRLTMFTLGWLMGLLTLAMMSYLPPAVHDRYAIEQAVMAHCAKPSRHFHAGDTVDLAELDWLEICANYGWHKSIPARLPGRAAMVRGLGP